MWLHECQRVFYDRLVDSEDEKAFMEVISSCLETNFSLTVKDLLKSQTHLLFTSFYDNSQQNQEGNDDDEDENASCPYQEVQNFDKLTDLINEKLEDFNMDPKKSSMNLVLFEEAIVQVCAIHRIISQPNGNAVLVGVGGSGRKSLTKLAAFIANYKLNQITITKGYGKKEFYEDLKSLFIQTGQEQEQTVFLFSDAQLMDASFLEDINNMLSSGEIPNLFPAEELSPILDSLRVEAKKAGYSQTEDNLYKFFIERSKKHLHIVFCMSPIGKGFTIEFKFSYLEKF